MISELDSKIMQVEEVEVQIKQGWPGIDNSWIQMNSQRGVYWIYCTVLFVFVYM